MSEQLTQPNPQVADDEIDLRELFRALWQGKWIIIVTTFLFSVASVFYALSLPNYYKSEVTLAPVSEDSSLKIPGQLGGLAALAGVNIGSIGGGDKTVIALEIMRSRDFLGRFIETNELSVPVLAAKGWSFDTGKLIINNKIYDEKNKVWVRKVSFPRSQIPSTTEVVESFRKMLYINQDKSTGIVKISIESLSPVHSKQWVEELVSLINNELRQRDIYDASNRIAYLNEKVNSTNISDIRSLLYSLIEEQTKTLMLASVSEEYVFRIIDPAFEAETKSRPRRALIVIITFLFSGVFSSIFSVVYFYRNK